MGHPCAATPPNPGPPVCLPGVVLHAARCANKPAYAASPVSGLVGRNFGGSLRKADSGPVPARRRALVCLSTLSFAMGGLPGSSRAQQAGAFSDETWTDAARSRAVPVRIRVPDGAGPWPLVLFSHGLGGSRNGADVWGRAWQAAGLLVVHVQHAGSDTEVALRGMAALRSAATAAQLLARVADVGFVIDEILRRHAAGLPMWSAVLVDRIGMAGHSFGAQTAQALAGQRYPAPGSLREPRLAAFLALSSSPARSSSLSLQEQFGAINRPFMAATGSLDVDPLGGALTGAVRASVYEGLPPGERALLWLEAADHMTFAGNASPRINGRGAFERAAQAWALEARHHEGVAEITSLWWQSTLASSAEDRSHAAAGLRRVKLAGAGDRLTLG